MTLDLQQFGASVLLNLLVTIIVLYVLIRKVAVPVLTALIEEKLEETSIMMKSAATALGRTGLDAKEMKKMEKMMMDDILEQYPEIEIALEYFSPETAEMIKKHPQRAMVLLARYKPVIEDILGMKSEGKSVYDI